MQTMVVTPGVQPPFTGTFDCLKQTFASGGVAGIYRGVTAPLVAVTPLFAICFWGYDMGQRVVRYTSKLKDEEDLSIGQLCIAGALSAIPSTVVAAPTERIKCVMQVQANSAENAAKNKTMLSFAQEMYKTGGIRSLYRGGGATLLRDGPGSAIYFGTYELLKKKLCELQGVDKSQLSIPAVLTSGGFAGMAMWATCMPIDVLKSRFQTAPEGMYSGLLDVYKHLIREEGYAALFKGMGPAMIRAFPANASVFLGVEFTKSLWDKFMS